MQMENSYEAAQQLKFTNMHSQVLIVNVSKSLSVYSLNQMEQFTCLLSNTEAFTVQYPVVWYVYNTPTEQNVQSKKRLALEMKFSKITLEVD